MKKLWKSFAAIMAALLLFAGCDQNADHVHIEDNGTVIAPTCVTKGYTVYKCTVCGKITKTENYVNELYSSPVDAETGSAATSSSTYIYFGVFPKTVLASTSTVTVDETTRVTMGGNTYYKGSDGEYYAKVTVDPYGSSYTYEDTTAVICGEERYFKVEPVKWKVLTTDYNSTGKALLLAEDILTAKVPYYVLTSNRTIGRSIVYANNYKYSTIRAYLNGSYETNDTQAATYSKKGFLQTAFTAAAQSLITTTTVDNSAASTTDAGGNITQATSYYCADTQDKIFLLSEQEATTTDYGFAAYNSYETGNARIRKATDYAKANYAYQNTSSICGGWWWLRSPSYSSSYSARSVDDLGDANNKSIVSGTIEGVVPALSISLQ